MSLPTTFFVLSLEHFDFSNLNRSDIRRLLMKTLSTQLLILIFKCDVSFLNSTKPKVYVVSLILSLVLDYFCTSGFSLICKIRNVCKHLNRFSRNTLIRNSEKTSWSLNILESKLSNKLKNGNEKFIPHKASLSISELHGLSIFKPKS
jgi:hypothetical protein